VFWAPHALLRVAPVSTLWETEGGRAAGTEEGVLGKDVDGRGKQGEGRGMSWHLVLSKHESVCLCPSFPRRKTGMPARWLCT
jgi:hypothetical protein